MRRRGRECAHDGKMARTDKRGVQARQPVSGLALHCSVKSLTLGITASSKTY